MSIIKVKCWNNEVKDWEECAYPLFKGMNPCEIIGFQDVDGSDKLIEDGHAVVLYSGMDDKNDVELFEDDICKYDDELSVLKYDKNLGQWMLHILKDGIILNNVRFLNHESARSIERVSSLYENKELIK